jgi:hypothetical protein
MIRKLVRKVLWLGRGTATVMGIAVMIAVVLGLATTSLAAVSGDPFKLGRLNSIDALTRIVGSVNNAMLRIGNDSSGPSATALELRVEPGQPPMKVDSDTKVSELNADEVDGKSASEISVNGLETISSNSVNSSTSPQIAIARCPTGKVVVGSGAELDGNSSGLPPDGETDVVLDEIVPSSTRVTVTAYEDEPTNANWDVTAYALCATAP